MNAEKQEIAERKRLRDVFYPKPKVIIRDKPACTVADRLNGSVRFLASIETNVTFGPAAYRGQCPFRASPISMRAIVRACCDHFGVATEDMLSHRRTARPTRVRQVAMYLCKTLTTRSLPDIGFHIGGRDHTTVLHAVRKIDALRESDPALAADIEAIKRSLMVAE